MKFEINQSIEIELQEDGTYNITLKGCSEETTDSIRQLDNDMYFTANSIEKIIDKYFCDYSKTRIKDFDCENLDMEDCNSSKNNVAEEFDMVELDDLFGIEPEQSNSTEKRKTVETHIELTRGYPLDEDFGCDEHGAWIEELAIKNSGIPVVEFDGANYDEYIGYRKSIGDPFMRYVLDKEHTDYNLYYEECGEDWGGVKRMRKLRNIWNFIMEK